MDRATETLLRSTFKTYRGQTLEQLALNDSSTRRLVHEVLALAETRDICDAIADMELAAAILKERLGK